MTRADYYSVFALIAGLLLLVASIIVINKKPNSQSTSTLTSPKSIFTSMLIAQFGIFLIFTVGMRVLQGSKGENIPTFPWPPPQASAFSQIDPQFMKKSDGPIYLRDISDKLAKALDEGGYNEKSWYSVPNGFALVTRIEQVNRDGTPVYGEYRWVADKVAPYEIKSIWDYVAALFNAKAGYYRVFVFIVSDVELVQTTEKVKKDEVEAWVARGVANGLPENIGQLPFTNQYKCTALIYEFMKLPGEDAPPDLIMSNLTGEEHLRKSKIWDALVK